MHYIDKIIKYKFLTVLLIISVICLSSYGMKYLEFVADLRVFFGDDNPQLKELKVFENTFTKDGSVSFVIVPENKDVFTRETLTAIKELDKRAWELPHSRRVDSLANFSHTRAEGDELIVEDLVVDPMSMTDEELKRLKDLALAEPMLAGSSLSLSCNLTMVGVTTTVPEGVVFEKEKLVSQARSLAKEIEAKYPHIDIMVTGSEIFNYAYTEVSQDDMMILYPIMFGIMIFMMFLLIRSLSGIISTLIVIIASAATAMGISGYLGIKLNSASTAAPIIILTLAVADSIHILVSFIYYLRQGKSKNEAITEAIRINLQPVLLTSITTAIGFLTMLTSDSPPFRDLGVTVAIGVSAACLFSLVLLPALMAILPVKSKNSSEKELKNSFLDYISNLVLNNRKKLFWGSSAFLVILSIGLPRIEFYDKFMEYFDDRYEVRRIADFLEDNISGISGFSYLLRSGEPGGINKPSFLNKADEFASWLLEQPEVSQVTSLIHTIKRLNRSMHGDDPAYYKIPDDRELVAQYLLLYEMSLPFGKDLNNLNDMEKSAMRFSVLLKRTSTKEMRTLEEKANQWLRDNAPPEMHSNATGMGIMFAHISERNIKSMLKSTGLALLIISVVLIFAFRSLKIGGLSLIPNLIPALMTFGLWGWLVGYVNMAVSYIAALSLGIVVDDSVHFLSKYLRARRELKMNPEEAIRYSFQTVGMALITTSIILSAGFTVLFFSGFEVNSALGLLMAIAIVFALVADFLFLPTLLLLVDSKKKI
jgi:uncharacterized protein